MKSLFIIVSVIFITYISRSQELTSIQFDNVVYDFGTIKEQDGPVTCDFKFKNTGKNTFKITEVSTSCGCTTPAYSREPVKPGDRGFIKVTYNPAKNNGSFSKLITITGNLENGAALLSIKGWVDPKIKVPEDEYNQTLGNLKFTNLHVALGEIYSTSVDTAKIKFYNAGTKPIIIQYFGGPPHIKYSKLPVSLLPKQKGEITIYYSAYMKKELGFVFDKIKLYTTDDVMPEKELTVVANIKINLGAMTETEKLNAAKIQFEETEHDFGDIAQGENGIFEFNFKNIGKSTLTIYSTKANCGCTATTVGKDKIEPGESSSIRVTYSTNKKIGKDQTQITVYTNDPANQVVKLTISANVLITSKSK